MSTVLSNKYKELAFKKVFDFSADVFKMILMKKGFVYNRASHNVYANVSADELPTLYGYTIGGVTMSGVSIVKDDVNNLGYAKWNNVSWLVSGGNIEAQGAIIFDDTIASPVVDPIIGYIDFVTSIITYDGGTFTVANPTVAHK